MGESNEQRRPSEPFFDPVENLKAVAEMQAAGIDAATKLLARFLQGGAPTGPSPNGASSSEAFNGAVPNGAASRGSGSQDFAPRFGAEPADGANQRSTRDLRVEAEQFIDQLSYAAKRMLDVWTDLGSRGPRVAEPERVVLTVIGGVGTATALVPAAVGDVGVSSARSSSGVEIAAACFRVGRMDLGDDTDRLAIRVDVPADTAPGAYHAVLTAPAVADFARLLTVMVPQQSVATPQPR